MSFVVRVVSLVSLLSGCAPPLLAQESPAPATGDDLETRLQAALEKVYDDTGVPAISAAVARGNRIAWAAGIGVRVRSDRGAAADANGVDQHTRFQAGSLSKPLTAIAVLRLVARGALDLDEPLSLPGTVALPRRDGTGDRQPTLRQLLSHTGGTTVHGFPGYPADAEVPDLAAVLAGSGNTEAIEIDLEPGTRYRYSGGGYCVIQRVLETVANRPFEELMQDLVLRPLGMADSTFAQPLPDVLANRAATAHDRAGAAMAERWFVHPEQAAAGLWTTAGDLLRALLAVNSARLGEDDAVLPPAIAEDMLTVQQPADRHGLGWMVRRQGEQLMFGHGGANQGFLCDARLMATGDATIAVAVMINSEQAEALQQITRALMTVARATAGR